MTVGDAEGELVGCFEGDVEGELEGELVGWFVGEALGEALGAAVGVVVGAGLVQVHVWLTGFKNSSVPSGQFPPEHVTPGNFTHLNVL